MSLEITHTFSYILLHFFPQFYAITFCAIYDHSLL